jgi:hypothetical protein
MYASPFVPPWPAAAQNRMDGHDTLEMPYAVPELLHAADPPVGVVDVTIVVPSAPATHSRTDAQETLVRP